MILDLRVNLEILKEGSSSNPSASPATNDNSLHRNIFPEPTPMDSTLVTLVLVNWWTYSGNAAQSVLRGGGPSPSPATRSHDAAAGEGPWGGASTVLLPSVPGLVQPGGCWPPPDPPEQSMKLNLGWFRHWGTVRGDSAFLGKDRWGQGETGVGGKKNPQIISCSSGEEHLKTTQIWHALHVSPKGGVGLDPTNASFTPAATVEVLLIWLSPMCGNWLYCFLKSDVFKGNIYPQASLTCDDSIADWQEKPTCPKGFRRQNAPFWLEITHLCSGPQGSLLENYAASPSLFHLASISLDYLGNSKYVGI